ncbi:MAG TPA: MFS transporter, partial [Glaciihabitans sp.]|nr:MFS transporter [Glaciihabitans sp.]
MPQTRQLPLWAGRTLALVGILLVALNLRTAVAAISPITANINADVPLSAVGLGTLGALPPIAFALSGLFAPLVARRLGLELSITVAAAAMVAGHIVRGFSDSYTVLLLGSILALAGMGIGNILLPPAVKRYFPDRIGLITTAYATLLAVSTAVPAVLAAPLADAAGWRLSLGMWSVLAATSLVPWLILYLRARRDRAAEPTDAPIDTAEPELFRRMLRSR